LNQFSQVWFNRVPGEVPEKVPDNVPEKVPGGFVQSQVRFTRVLEKVLINFRTAAVAQRKLQICLFRSAKITWNIQLSICAFAQEAAMYWGASPWKT